MSVHSYDYDFCSCLAAPIQQFLHTKRALGRRYDTEESALRLLDRFLAEGPVKAPDEISAELLDSFLASRPRQRPRSYNHLLGVVDRFFDWLVNQTILERSPVQAKRRRPTGDLRPFLFDAPLIRRLLEAAARLPDRPQTPTRGPIYRTIFALLYSLGLRVGEVSRLRWKDVDLERDLLEIRCTKFSKDRWTPFGSGVHRLLEEFLLVQTRQRRKPNPQDPVFSFVAGQPINPKTISRTFRYLTSQLELEVPPGTAPPRAHCLRHSFAVGTLLRWYQRGIDPTQKLHHLATFLGHVDPTTTAVYLTITDELLYQANRRFEEYAVGLFKETQP